MVLRFKIPMQFYIIGKTMESLSLSTSFTQNRIACSVTLEGENQMEYPDPPDSNSKYFISITKLSFIMRSDGPEDSLQEIMGAKPHFDLVKLLAKTANRCIRAIRNIGLVAGIREYYDKEIQDINYLLDHWNVEIQEVDESWKKLYEPSGDDWLKYFGKDVPFSRGGDFNVLSWKEIEEYIQDDLRPPPEIEFLVNAAEHSHIGNFRLSLLESVIGLEVVLSRYLRDYMKIIKKLPKKRVEGFIEEKLGLTARVSGLLSLTAPKNILEKIDIGKVLQGISWRNKILHRYGNLPTGIPLDQVSVSIAHILRLSHLLGAEINSLNAKPLFDQISESIRDKYGYGPPSISLMGRHLINIKFNMFEFEQLPSQKDINKIAGEYVNEFKKRDRRFDEMRHLNIKVVELPSSKTRASWFQGQYNEFEDKESIIE